MKKNNKAFTLIELLIAIAIIAIMSAVILVSMKSYGAKARSSKALAELSSAIPSTVSCWGNGNNVQDPSSGGVICNDSSNNAITSYGNWPMVGTGTDLSTYYYSGAGTMTDNSKWYLYLNSASGDDNVRICCNSAMKSCKAVTPVDNCTAIVPSN